MKSNKIPRQKTIIIPVILAGGKGKRLWPLTQHTPKELLLLPNGKTFLENTILQIKSIPHIGTPIVISNVSHQSVIKSHLKKKKLKIDLLLETKSQNTAVSVALAMHYALKKYVDPILLIVPVDAVVSNKKLFARMIHDAVDEATSGKIVIFGVKPTYPATEYGYIQTGKKLLARNGFFVKKFLEKPTLQRARRFIQSKNYLLNSGMVLFQASVGIAEIKMYAPRLHSIIIKKLAHLKNNILNTNNISNWKPISFDSAVLEKTKHSVVFPFKGGWQDVGNWKALYDFAISQKK